MSKLFSTERLQRQAEETLELVGPDGVRALDDPTALEGGIIEHRSLRSGKQPVRTDLDTAAKVAESAALRPAHPDDGAGSVRHRLSVAAQAFKAQALAAAAVPVDEDEATELFRNWRLHRRVDSG